ncbi:MAG: helix-turn-helix domain-containing protein [Chthonomonadales bacterium]|nr:helix-turn-helix domain-containing protein [Chthonomonadales bacterium]
MRRFPIVQFTLRVDEMNTNEQTRLINEDFPYIDRTPHGQYQREPHAIADLRRLMGMPAYAVPKAIADLSPEAGVCAFRIAYVMGLTGVSDQIVEALLYKCVPYILRRLPRYGVMYALEDIRSDLAVVLIEQWRRTDSCQEFWEVRFWHCLGLRIRDVVRPYCRFGERDADGPSPFPETLQSMPSAVNVEEEAIHRVMLDGLPDNLRRAVVLRHRHGYTEGEIARRMGVTSRTIRNWLTKARELLIKHYGGAER